MKKNNEQAKKSGFFCKNMAIFLSGLGQGENKITGKNLLHFMGKDVIV